MVGCSAACSQHVETAALAGCADRLQGVLWVWVGVIVGIIVGVVVGVVGTRHMHDGALLVCIYGVHGEYLWCAGMYPWRVWYVCPMHTTP